MEKIFNKIPKPTLRFFIINILLTILEEISKKKVSIDSQILIYAISIIIFSAVTYFVVAFQIKMSNFNPANYWIGIIATSILGSSIVKFIIVCLGANQFICLGIFAFLLLTTFLIWYYNLRSISIYHINNTKAEVFYWVAILFSQGLGSIIGEYTSYLKLNLTHLLRLPWLLMLCTILCGFSNEYDAFSFIIITIIIFASIIKFAKNSRNFRFWLFFILTQPLAMMTNKTIKKLSLSDLLSFPSKVDLEILGYVIFIIISIIILKKTAD